MSNKDILLSVPVELWASTVHALRLQSNTALCYNNTYERIAFQELAKSFSEMLPRFWKIIDDDAWSRIIIGLRDNGSELIVTRKVFYKTPEKRTYEPIKVVLKTCDVLKTISLEYSYLSFHAENDLDYFYNVDLVLGDMKAFYEQYGKITVLTDDRHSFS